MDISASNSLILHIFTSCFDVISGSSKASSGEEIGKNVEFHMTGLLDTLVDEAQILPEQVVDIILAQFLRADPRVVQVSGGKGKKGEAIDRKQSTLLMKQAPPGYNMAVNVCNSHPDKMGRYITQYFSQVIVNASGAGSGMPSTKTKLKGKGKGVEEAEDEEMVGPTETELKELQKAHRLARELWRATPDVLQNIVPQIEAELGAENEDIRLLATETIGDMVAGIGAAGLPPPPTLDPAAYPSQSLQVSHGPPEYNFLTTPNSPHAFKSVHSTPYHTFLGRRNDKSSRIRAAWTTAVGRIILTSAGSVGLDDNDESNLLNYLAAMLMDGDEKVRLSAVEVVSRFGFQDIIDKLGKTGGITDSGSVLCNLSERMKDPRHIVRTEAMTLLGKVWGVACGAIAERNERVQSLFAPIPSKIFDAVYINDLAINFLVDNVLYEQLFPLQFPPARSKQTNGASHKSTSFVNGDSQLAGYQDDALNADKVRVERMLLLVRDLEPRARKVFFAFQARQIQNAKFMDAFLKRCEEYNGGVMEKKENETKKRLKELIDWHAKTLPDPTKATEDLQKFAKMHDRRSYKLIRFCVAHESDYRKVQKALKELTKRIEESLGSAASVLDTIVHLVWRASIIFYNISHVSPIMEFARTDEKDLSSTAHEVLKEMSSQNPEIFKTHIKELCEDLVQKAPSEEYSNDPDVIDTLKACVGFARKFPQEMPDDLTFTKSMTSFARYGSPPQTAKHAVSVLMCSKDKDVHARRLLTKPSKDFTYGSSHFLSKLATYSQVMLLAADEIENDLDDIFSYVLDQRFLPKNPVWDPSFGIDWYINPNSDLQAKSWALKLLVNRVRTLPTHILRFSDVAEPVYTILNALVKNDDGEGSKTEFSSNSHRNTLRLQASQLLLKLSAHGKDHDHFLTPSAFNTLATVAQDQVAKVRDGFARALMKRLGTGSSSKLSSRFYVPIFLLAFEPTDQLKSSAQTWLRARTATLQRNKDITIEHVFARFLSCLSWHPDFDNEEEDLLGFVQYILFYLQCVASAENLPLIFHVAQRVKTVQDGVSDEADESARAQASERLYIISELAQEVIRRFAEEKGWSLQAWPGKLNLPADIFARMSGHERAQEVARKQYLLEGVRERLEGVVRVGVKGKKRKLDYVDAGGKKRKAKTEGAKGEKVKPEKRARSSKTPKKKRAESEDLAPSSERRRSGRTKGRKSYAEQDDSEDERDMERWNRRNEREDEGDASEGQEEARSQRDSRGQSNKDGEETGEDEDTEMPDAEPEVKPEVRSRGQNRKKPKMEVTAGTKGRGGKRNQTPIPISSDKESDDDLSDPPEEDEDA